MRAPWFCDGPWRGLPKGLTFHVDVITKKTQNHRRRHHRQDQTWENYFLSLSQRNATFPCRSQDIFVHNYSGFWFEIFADETRYAGHKIQKSLHIQLGPKVDEHHHTTGHRGIQVTHNTRMYKKVVWNFPPARVYTKGASEIVMKKCSFLLSENGRVDSFTAHHQDRWWYFIYAFVRDIFCHCPVF